MKRRLCLVLFLLMLVTCVTASGEAADWNYDANYGILRGYNGAGGDVVVPGELDGFTVDVIGAMAMAYRIDGISDCHTPGSWLPGA